jgi:hypothetical protein
VAPPPNNIIFANIHNRAVINNVINRPPQPAAPVAGLGTKAGGRPGAPVAPVAPGQGGATPTLPPAVAQRATLIQQGKAPVPPSATINPCRAGWLARHGAGRKAERDTAGQCAGGAAFDPAFAADQRPAGSGCQGRATAAERCRIARRRPSEREPRRDAAGISGSDRSRFQARHRRHGAHSAGWPAETRRLRPGEGRSPATRRRRAAKARRCACAKTAIAA